MQARIRRPLFIAVLASVAIGATDVRADWLETFDLGFDQSWTFASTDDVGAPPDSGVSTFEIIEAGVDDYLRISHTTRAFRDGGGGATDGFGYVSETHTAAAVSAIINAAPGDGQQSVLAVFARGNPLTGDAYVAGVSYANSTFAIARNDDFVNFLNPLAIDNSVTIDSNVSHEVQLWVVGSNVTARLLDATTRETLSMLTAVDGSYASGVSGILVQTAYDGFDNPVAPIVGTFDEVEALPEPAFSLMILVGAAGLCAAGGRRRRDGGCGGLSG